jgi:hypothetical protein
MLLAPPSRDDEVRPEDQKPQPSAPRWGFSFCRTENVGDFASDSEAND